MKNSLIRGRKERICKNINLRNSMPQNDVNKFSPDGFFLNDL